jgi:hypothetical protein
MKRLVLPLFCCALFAGPVCAAADEYEWAQALEIPCHPLVTEAECRAHRAQLARMPEGAERSAYLARHIALIEERVKSCGCSVAHNGVGVLRYR